MTEELRRTPLYDAHVRLNARIVDYAGWAMPVLYSGILEEARAVRNHVGIFDISHMGRTRIHGVGATHLLQSLTTNDVDSLALSQAQYSLLTNPNGGIIDDIILYREAEESYLVVINASNTEKDLTWIRSHSPPFVTIEDNTAATAMIAIQGPEAPELVAELADDASLLTIGRFHYTNGTIGGASATFCRTGYTGEDGFEVIVAADQATQLWNALIVGGATPCGLGARDALRIEAGYPLYGHEIDDTTTPVEAGLMWAVKLDKGPFTGCEIIRASKERGPDKRLVGLVSQERIQPRQGYTIYIQNKAVGEITSGVFSPTLGRSVAMGYVSSGHSKAGTPVEIAIRDKRAVAILTPKKNLLTSST